MAGGCLLLIYSSLYIARPITEWLREANLLRVAVGVSFLAVAVWVALRLRRMHSGWQGWLTLGGIAGFYLLLISRFELPEERLHFLEYGVVGGLVYLALLERQRNRHQDPSRASPAPGGIGPALAAVVITGLAGWLDEGIQEILPNRFYDLRDVAMNAAGGALAVASIWLLDLARRAADRSRA